MRLNNKLKQLIMKKSILIAFLSVFVLTGIFGQVIIVNTSPIAPASLTTCVGGTVNVVYSITNTTGSPLTWSGVTFKVEFNNMVTPTLIGSTAPVTITIPALSTTANFTVVGTLPSVPDGLYNIRAKMYNTFNNPINGTLPAIVNQIYVKNTPATPTITPAGPLSVCVGGSVSLTSSSASTYTWSTGANTQSISATPSVSTTYSVSTSNQCGIVTSFGVLVNVVLPPVTPSISANPLSVCSGGSSTLTILTGTSGGVLTQTWSTGSTTSLTVVNPTVATNYSVALQNQCGISYSGLTTINITPNPSISIVAVGSTTFCSNSSLVLNASATNYTSVTWSNAQTGTVVSVSSGGTYYATASSACGTSTSNIIVATVISSPTVVVVSSNSVLCAGQTATLTATGANTYSWMSGPTTDTFAITPSVNTLYFVTGTALNGCTHQGNINQMVTICTGVENSNIKSVTSKAYPVPSNDNVNIELSNVNDNSKISINIYSIEGKNVLSYETELNGNKTNVNVSNLNNGMYVLEVVSDIFKSTSRIVVNK